jgi:hypothetical protein
MTNEDLEFTNDDLDVRMLGGNRREDSPTSSR